MTPDSRSRLRALLLLVVALLVAVYSVAGLAMAGSFATAHPERRGHRAAAWVYVGVMALSAAGALAALVSLRRR